MRQHRVADDAVQFGARQAQGVHALELKRRLDAALHFLLAHAALHLEAVQRRPALLVRLETDLLGDWHGHEQHRRAGVDDEVERPLAVDLRAHEDMLRVGELERNLVGLERFLGLVRPLDIAGAERRRQAQTAERQHQPE